MPPRQTLTARRAAKLARLASLAALGTLALTARPLQAQTTPKTAPQTKTTPKTKTDPAKASGQPARDSPDSPRDDQAPDQAPSPADAASARQGLSPQEEDALFQINEGDELLKTEEDDAQRRDRPLEQPIKGMSDAELREAGFVFGDAQDSRVRSTATLLALFPGSLAHGIGHWYMGDRRAAIILAAMETMGLGLFLGAGLSPVVYGADFGASSATRHLMYLGAGLFAASYVLDVVGTIQGADPLLFKHPSDAPRKASVGLKYGYLELGELPIRNVLLADAVGDLGAGYVELRTLQDVGLTLSTYGATLGARPWRHPELPGARLELEVDAEWMQWRQRGRFERVTVAGLVGGSLDLGFLSKTMQRVALGLKTGYLHQWFALPAPTRFNPLEPEPEPSQWSHDAAGLPFMMWVQFDLSRRTRMRMEYTRRDGALLHDGSPALGVPAMQINYRSTANLDIEARADWGSGLGLWAGLRIWAGPSSGEQIELYEELDDPD